MTGRKGGGGGGDGELAKSKQEHVDCKHITPGQPVSASLRQMQYNFQELLTPAASNIQLQNKTKLCQIVGGMDAKTCKHYVTSL